ncbi:MAG: hypothetical protein KGJ51_05970 [Acidobacteriota bacterium]|nr:hypothetical protein [Acidobacteriota bacterium]
MHLALMGNLAFFAMQTQLDPQQAQKLAMAILAIMPLFIIVALAIVIVPVWFICKKAGFSPWLSLLNIVPLGGLILLYVLAFSEWRVVPAAPPGWPPAPPSPPQF